MAPCDCLWLCCWISHERREYSVSAATAAAQPGENERVCSSSSSSSFLPASQLTPCLPWVQRTVHIMKYSETASVFDLLF